MYKILYNDLMVDLKDISWEGSSLEDLLKFPPAARRAMGYQLHLVQSGEMPADWKVLNKLGKGVTGVYKIRLSIDKNIYRTAYVAKFADMVTVLHC
jgi:phage-related protein